MYAWPLEWNAVVQQHHLTGSHYRVWNQLSSMMEWNNWLEVSQQELADLSGLTQPAVSRIMKDFRAWGLVLRERYGDRGLHRYRVSPYLVWRGSMQVRNRWMLERGETERVHEVSLVEDAAVNEVIGPDDLPQDDVVPQVPPRRRQGAKHASR